MIELELLESTVKHLNLQLKNLFEKGTIIDFTILYEIKYNGFLEQLKYETYDNTKEESGEVRRTDYNDYTR